MTEWRTFECPDCGDVEDIDVAEMSSVTIYPCKECGAPLEMIDEIVDVGDDLHKILGDALARVAETKGST